MAPKKGGKKGKKAKNHTTAEIERLLVFKNIDELQEYAQVNKLLGNCRGEVYCFDGKTRLAHIRGNMTRKKKVWVCTGDIVMVSLREYEDAKCDIIYVYNSKEVKKLKLAGELPDDVKLNDDETTVDVGIDFTTEDKESEEEDIKKDFDFENL